MQKVCAQLSDIWKCFCKLLLYWSVYFSYKGIAIPHSTVPTFLKGNHELCGHSLCEPENCRRTGHSFTLV